jgi:hypothetical protein
LDSDLLSSDKPKISLRTKVIVIDIYLKHIQLESSRWLLLYPAREGGSNFLHSSFACEFQAATPLLYVATHFNLQKMNLYQQQQQHPAECRSNNNTIMRNAEPGTFVTELRPCDVLFGRGSGPNDHEGNVRFRHLVAERKNEYMATNHRQTKTNIARQIVSRVQGNFLKKVDATEAGFPAGTDVYEVVDDDTVMEKAKQALRQNATKNRNDTMFGFYPGDPEAATGTTTSADMVPQSGNHHHHHPTTNYPTTRTTIPHHHHGVYPEDDLEPFPLQSSDIAAATAAAAAAAAAGYPPRQNDYMGSAAAAEVPVPIRSSSSDYIYQNPGNTRSSSAVDYSYQNRGMVNPSSSSNNNNNNELFVSSAMPPPQPRPPAVLHHPQPQQQSHMVYQNLPRQQQPRQSTTPATNNNSVWYQSAMQAPVSRASSDSIDILDADDDDFVAPSPLPVQYGSSPGRNSISLSGIRTANAATYSQQQPPPPHSDLANYSMAEIPGDDIEEVFHDRNKAARRRSSDYTKFNSKDGNTSIRMSQLFRGSLSGGGGSSVMDELMDSFNQMRTGDEAALNRRFMASTETMGTIEPLGSVADMSLGTMNSSTFSLLRGNESVTLSDESSQHLSLLGSTGNHTSSSTATRSSKFSNESSTSLNITEMYDLTKSKKITDSNNSSSLNGMITDIRKQVDSEFNQQQQQQQHYYQPHQHQTHMFIPRSSIGTVEETSSDEMGDSSQDVFQSVLAGFKKEDETDDDILPPQDYYNQRSRAAPEQKNPTLDDPGDRI